MANRSSLVAIQFSGTRLAGTHTFVAEGELTEAYNGDWNIEIVEGQVVDYEDPPNAHLRTSPGELLQLYGERVLFFLTRTRWTRMGRMVV